MANLARCQVNWPLFSTSSGQSVSNTFYFTESGTQPFEVVDAALPNGVGEAAALKIDAFYEALNPYLSGNAVNPGTLSVYDMFDPEPRFPVYQNEISSAKSTGAALPSEVALCLSFRASTPSGTIRARRRGRVFLGPLVVAAASGSAATPARPVAGWTTALNAAVEALMDTVTTPVLRWQQYSETTGQFGFIVEAWYDDAFDTQRRRGAPPASRNELVID